MRIASPFSYYQPAFSLFPSSPPLCLSSPPLFLSSPTPIGDPASFAATNETQQRQRHWILAPLSVIPDPDRGSSVVAFHFISEE